LGIYKYQGNWTPAISNSINTLWKRISNLDGTNSDNSVNLTTLTASARVSDVRGVYVLAEFICGNQECEVAFGESSNNCPSDCPSVPSVVTPGAGAGGVGVGAGAGAGGAGAGAGPGNKHYIAKYYCSKHHITKHNRTKYNKGSSRIQSNSY
jgi:hypothetical protein